MRNAEEKRRTARLPVLPAVLAVIGLAASGCVIHLVETDHHGHSEYTLHVQSRAFDCAGCHRPAVSIEVEPGCWGCH